MAPKRRSRSPGKLPETPPEVKRMRRQQKYDVNRRIAVELVDAIRADRGRTDEDVVKVMFDRHIDVYGADLVDKNQAYRLHKQILEGRAQDWLPADYRLSTEVNEKDKVTTVSTLTQRRNCARPNAK